MAAEVVRRCAPLPLGFSRKICDPLSRESVTASFEPSGDQAGAEFEPLKLAAMLRLPSASECTYTTGFLFSNDTYAIRLPSGDQVGEMIGSCDLRMVWSFRPSASAICSS